MKRNRLGNYRVPTFFINGNTSLEFTKQKISFIEVSVEMFGNFILLFECPCSMIILVKFKIDWLYLKVS